MEEQQIKQSVKKRYGRIALTDQTEGCCAPTSNNCGCSEESIGYSKQELNTVPERSILGVGCGAPVNFANIKEGEIVVDLGSGAGIDVFLCANKVRESGKVIGIDMTDEMLQRARSNAKQGGYSNVEFQKGDIERRIPVEDNSVDLVISNCVINLTVDKTAVFKEVHRILKDNGRIVIADLVTSKETELKSIKSEDWCDCIDGALTKENYIDSIMRAGFNKVEVIQETPYTERDARQITSVVIKATK
jgi:ubiquinone/menaquinone biosynthesis C-methylase UbiE